MGHKCLLKYKNILKKVWHLTYSYDKIIQVELRKRDIEILNIKFKNKKHKSYWLITKNEVIYKSRQIQEKATESYVNDF